MSTHTVFFSPRLVGETVTVSIDMSALTPTPSAAAVTASVYSGTADPSPSATLVGSPVTTGTVISQQTSGGVSGTTYQLAFSFSIPGGDRLTVFGVLPVI